MTGEASLGPLVNVPGNTAITAPVVRQINLGRVVILRDTYTKAGGGIANRWMLATLYTTNPDNTPAIGLAHDPWTASRSQSIRKPGR